jgi:Na+-transporting methylmalonyl-CoA/oxaloacetate decarboxylase gamma subunit
MNEPAGSLLVEGLKITVIGLAWVFAALALVWGLVVLLNRIFPGRVESSACTPEAKSQPAHLMPGVVADADALTAERARVAAIVAAALMAGALPVHAEAPVGPAFEHGRTAPNWVTGNRARALRPWQPPRQKVN